MAVMDTRRALASMAPYWGGTTDTGFLENIGASYRGAWAVDRQVSEMRNLSDAYDRLLARINRGLPEGDRLVNPVKTFQGRQFRAAQLPNLPKAGPGGAFFQGAMIGLAARDKGDPTDLEGLERQFWEQYAGLQTATPEAFRDDFEGRDDFVDELRGRAAAAEAEARQTAMRADLGGNIGAILGSMGAHLTDPPNQAAMLVGAPFGWGLLSRMAVEAGIGAATEAAFQVQVQDYREELGLEHGFAQALQNVTFAGLGAGGLTGALGLIGIFARAGMRGVEKAVGRTLTETERGAVQYTARQMEMIGESPHSTGDAEVIRLAADAYDRALAAARQGETFKGGAVPAPVVRSGRSTTPDLTVEVDGQTWVVTNQIRGPGTTSRRVGPDVVPDDLAREVTDLMADPRIRQTRQYLAEQRQWEDRFIADDAQTAQMADIMARFNVTEDQIRALQSAAQTRRLDPDARARARQALSEGQAQGVAFDDQAARRRAGTTKAALETVRKFEDRTGRDLFEVADQLGLRGPEVRPEQMRRPDDALTPQSVEYARRAAETDQGRIPEAEAQVRPDPADVGQAGGQGLPTGTGPAEAGAGATRSADDPAVTAAEIARIPDADLDQLEIALPGGQGETVKARALLEAMDDRDAGAQELLECVIGTTGGAIT